MLTENIRIADVKVGSPLKKMKVQNIAELWPSRDGLTLDVYWEKFW